MHTKMDRNTKSLGLAIVATSALAFGLIGCSAADDDDDCRTQPVVMFFNTSTGHYHYGSPKGKTVPAYKVPQSARKVPGYKPVGPAKPPVNKVPKGSGSSNSKPSLNKPAAPAPKPAPAPRTGRR